MRYSSSTDGHILFALWWRLELNRKEKGLLLLCVFTSAITLQVGFPRDWEIPQVDVIFLTIAFMVAALYTFAFFTKWQAPKIFTEEGKSIFLEFNYKFVKPWPDVTLAGILTGGYEAPMIGLNRPDGGPRSRVHLVPARWVEKISLNDDSYVIHGNIPVVTENVILLPIIEKFLASLPSWNGEVLASVTSTSIVPDWWDDEAFNILQFEKEHETLSTELGVADEGMTERMLKRHSMLKRVRGVQEAKEVMTSDARKGKEKEEKR